MRNLASLVLILMLLIVSACSTGTPTGNSTDKPENASSATSAVDDKPPADADGNADLSLEKFNKIEFDMTYNQVKEIIGAHGKTKSTSTFENKQLAQYEWNGEGFDRITANFRDGKLIMADIHGLQPDKGTAELSMEKYEKIKNDMTYEEVKEIIGSDGIVTTKSKNLTDVKLKDGEKKINIHYEWKSPTGGRITAQFMDNKLIHKFQMSL